MEKKVLEGLKLGNAVLSQIHSEMMPLEAIDELLADTAEAAQKQSEISAMLSGIQANDLHLEEEAEAELEKMIQESNIESEKPLMEEQSIETAKTENPEETNVDEVEGSHAKEHSLLPG